jgi:radical SAM protein with 4Fe4S-binding SPASM domain
MYTAPKYTSTAIHIISFISIKTHYRGRTSIICKDDLIEIWNTSQVLDKMRNKEPKGKCLSCDSQSECLGGCTARTLGLTGDMNNPDPHCWKDES